jgi:UDP-2,4-diacetamido-2,4,6-trideoxy-beta-L-altropyranose hydrolase
MSTTAAALVLRADADHRIGTGHVMRGLALGQAWQDRFSKVHFVCARLPQAMQARLEAEGFVVTSIDVEPGSAQDAEATLCIAEQERAQWISADGYVFGDVFQQAITESDCKLLLVDDYGHQHYYCADILLNQNLGSAESLYPRRAEHMQLLLGSRYAMLRRQFTSQRGWQRPERPARRLLLTLGGADPDNVTGKVLDALELLSDKSLSICVVVGGAYQHQEELTESIARLPFDTQVIQNASNMPELMAEADLAIAAGGTTCWELAFMGLPAVLVVLADNQKDIARHTAAQGLTVNLGWHSKLTPAQLSGQVGSLLADPKQRAAMSKRGQQAVDGYGADRVVDAMMGERS